MTKILKFWPVAVALLAFLLWVQHNAALRNEGALREQLAGLTQRNARLEEDAGRIDTVYARDTIRLRIVRNVTDSILIRDSIVHTDTVRMLVEQERAACSAVVLTCEQQKANLRAQIANLDSTITAINKQRPGWFKRTTGKLGYIGAGIVAGVVLSK